jgi:polyferredoxin
VQVCPTGIDIRQGLQMECIGCANCIDACNEIMDRVDRPRGLIRYDSLKGLAGERTRVLRPRIIFYCVLLALGAVVASVGVKQYQPATLGITRMQGAPYFIDAESVRNQFFLRLINKGGEPVAFGLTVAPGPEAPANVRVTGWDAPVELGSGAEELRPLIVQVPRGEYNGRFPFEVVVRAVDGGVEVRREAEFIGPDPKLFRAHEPVDR